MHKQINHDKFHDESKTRTHRLSKLPDDGDPWAPNNLLTPEQKKNILTKSIVEKRNSSISVSEIFLKLQFTSSAFMNKIDLKSE